MTTTAVTVTEFKAHCLDLIRRVEKEGAPLDLLRHGKVVARLVPSAGSTQGEPIWLRLRGRGRLLADAEESVLGSEDFDAARGD